MKMRINNRSFTFAELLVAAIVSAALIGVLVSFYFLTNRTYSRWSSEQRLQECANIILTKIREGGSEPGGIFRLSEAASYTVTSLSELHFTGTDGIDRSFKLNSTATSLVYHHPILGSPTGADETIFTAPNGATITLRFSIPLGAQYTGIVVGIDVTVTQNVSGRVCSGSVSTYVNIRNHLT